MKHLVFFLLSWTAWGGLEASAQLCKVEGKVSDALSGEALIGAYIKAGNQVVATDFDGHFNIDLPRGVVVLEVSYIGYESQRREVNCDRATAFVSFALETLLMNEAIVATDIAIDRKTPVAFTNVLPAQIQEELAGRDLPMVLNTTPGVYATQQGGGDGDARVTIRGFDQTNLAVMVDGVPMNDMETGQVYWSNWSGLDLVVKTFQVQRGLGASKLALPAVGGTMNILTGGNENANGELNYQSEIGSYGYMRNSISGVFGSQDKGFLHVAGSYKTNEGFANGLFSEAWAYYVKGTKTSGRHRLSLTAFGAPQRHGQRSYTAPIHHYSMAMAQNLYQDTVYNQLVTEIQAEPDGVANDFGFDFNPFVLNYSDNEYVAGDSLGIHPEYGLSYAIADTIPGRPLSRTSRLNFYHKPIVTLRDFFRINDRVSLVTTAYASFGTGGGMRLDGARPGESDVIGGGGEIDYQRLYDANEGIFNINNAQFLASPFGLSRASGWLASSYNNHRWWGGLSTLTAEATEHMTVSAGVDVRRYVGIHYRAVEDFVGGDLAAVALEDRDHNMPYDSPLGIGDKYLYHDEGHVAWGGGFGQVEWDHYNWSAFANVSVAKSWYKGIDFFRPKVLEIDGVTYEVNSESRGGVLGSFDYDTPSILAEDTTDFQNDLVFVDGEQILASDSRLQTYETPWIQLSGFTLKGGGSYLVHENFSVFGNLGYLSKAPQFNSVIDFRNDIIDGYKNQFVKAVELGAKFTSARFSSNLNIYRTGWENRAVNRFISFKELVGDSTLSCYNPGLDEENARDYGVNLLTVDALHRGVEWDFSYEPTPKLDLEGVLSLGDWRWANNPIVDFINRNNPTETITFVETGQQAFDTLRIDGLPVGNAAQTQLGMSLTYRPIPGSYVRLRVTQFSDQWADYAPQDAFSSREPREPWKMPNYNLMDFMAGARIDISDNADVTLRLMVTNIWNQRVITDARGNDDFGWTSSEPGINNLGEFNASRATVFVGPPRMVRLSAVLGLKGLQNRKPKRMNSKKISLALMAACLSTTLVAQDNILDMRENYNIGQTVTVTGVVTSDDNLGSVRYLQDATAGIALYPGADWSDWDATPEIGDSLTVTGEITEYNGLLEVGPDLTSVQFFGTGTLPEPLEIAPDAMDESLEGQLVRVNGVTFPLAGTFIAGNATYDFQADGAYGIMYVRTSNSLVGEELTGCEIDMIGIVSQFSFDGFGGYQLLPRGPVDLIPAADLCFTSPVSQTNLATDGFRLSWTTDLACDGSVEYGPTPDLGFVAEALQLNTPSHFVDLVGLDAGSIYYARAVCTTADGASATSQIRPYATVSESSGDIHVYFNGAVDHSVATDELALSLGTDMNDTVAAWITSAQHTLDVAAYNFNDQTLAAAFNTAASNGVQIRWIYEGQNANTGLGSLDASVVTHPRTDGDGSGMHNKFIIADADHADLAFVLTGSTNLTTGNLVSDLNDVIIFEDQSLARAYELEFEEMWGAEGMTPDPSNAKFGAEKTWNTPVDFLIGGHEVDLYFSPSDGTTAAIQKEIDAANADMEFALLTLTRDDLGEAIVDLNQSFFVSPIGVIEQVNTTGSEFDNLIANGVQVYHHDLSGDLHHKYCIIDHSEVGTDPLVITGSHNWSSTAETVNDENTVIVHSARVANLYHQEFRAIVNAVTGADGVSDARPVEWNVMPNPARDQVWVQGVPAEAVLSLMDASGREVDVTQWRQGTAVQLAFGGLSSGMYHLALTLPNGQTASKRLAIQ